MSNTARIEMSMGEIVIELLPDVAPKHTENFVKLANEGFYEGTTFHRVIPNFMIQGGDPNSKSEDKSTHGSGGPGYTIKAEISARHNRGSVAAARLGDAANPDRQSSGCQFYICVVPTSHLDGQYSVFGKVIEGMDVIDKIVAAPADRSDNPLEKIEIQRVTMG